MDYPATPAPFQGLKLCQSKSIWHSTVFECGYNIEEDTFWCG